MQYPGAGEALISDLNQLVADGPGLGRLDPRPGHQAAAGRAQGAGRRGARLRPRGRPRSDSSPRPSPATPTSRSRRSCTRAARSSSPSGWTACRCPRSSPRDAPSSATPPGSATCEFLLAGPAAGRPAARRPAPRQLPAAAGRPPRRPRLRRGRPAARRAAAGRSASCCAGHGRRRRGRARRPARGGLRQARHRRSTPRPLLDYLDPFLRPAARDDVPLHPGLAARAVRAHQRPPAAPVHRG